MSQETVTLDPWTTAETFSGAKGVLNEKLANVIWRESPSELRAWTANT
jgi:hypothetical protein